MPQPSVLMAYYSMTGNTKAAAEDVAARLGADIEPLVASAAAARLVPAALCDSMGPLAWKAWSVLPSRRCAADYDLVIIAGPIWLGRLAPPVIAWAHSNPIAPRASIALLVSAESGFVFRNALTKLDGIYDRKPVAISMLTDADRQSGIDANKLAEFLNSCGAETVET